MIQTRPGAIGERTRDLARGALHRTDWGRSLLDSRRKRKAIAFYRNFIQDDSLCFDIGANVGMRTELFRAIGARTVAIEPQTLCIAELRERFGKDPGVVIEPVALADKPGTAQIAVCDKDSTISTMSDRWQSEGRFSDQEWASHETVTVTTLDHLIDSHGRPTFCKVDVEGFEKQVLEGLSSPLACVSFEFTQEFLSEAKACIGILEELAPVSVNASLGESMQLMREWTSPEALLDSISRLSETQYWGDIYVRSPDISAY